MTYLVKHLESDALHVTDSLDGYGEPDWLLIGEVPETIPLDLVSVVDGKVAADLEAARAKRWEAIKLDRMAAQDDGCDTPLGRMDTDSRSREFLNGTVQMAVIAKNSGAPFNISWTMADNTVREHDADQIIAAGIAVGQFIAACHTAGEALRDKLYGPNAVTTLEEILEVKWVGI